MKNHNEILFFTYQMSYISYHGMKTGRKESLIKGKTGTHILRWEFHVV